MAVCLSSLIFVGFSVKSHSPVSCLSNLSPTERFIASPNTKFIWAIIRDFTNYLHFVACKSDFYISFLTIYYSMSHQSMKHLPLIVIPLKRHYKFPCLDKTSLIPNCLYPHENVSLLEHRYYWGRFHERT